MAKFTLRDVMQVLEEGWGEYIKSYEGLPPKTQAAFPIKEGFNSFHDLLAHIVGWWEEALWIITGILEDPNFTWEKRDTDEFNRVLIEKYNSWSEEDLQLHYENVREAILNLVAELPEDVLSNDDICNWLYTEVIEHWKDHRLPS